VFQKSVGEKQKFTPLRDFSEQPSASFFCQTTKKYEAALPEICITHTGRQFSPCQVFIDPTKQLSVLRRKPERKSRGMLCLRAEVAAKPIALSGMLSQMSSWQEG